MAAATLHWLVLQTGVAQNARCPFTGGATADTAFAKVARPINVSQFSVHFKVACWRPPRSRLSSWPLVWLQLPAV